MKDEIGTVKQREEEITMERRDNISTVYFDSPEWIAFGEEDGDDSDFEFVPRDPDSGKEITPAFPLFGRPLSPSGDAAAVATPAPELETLIPIQKLLIEDRDSLPASTSSSECDELESVPDATYCAWSPEQKRRSASEGGSRRWRLMDLVEGRSRSDGNKRFVGVAPGEKDKKPKSATIKEEVKKKAKGSKKVTELDMVTAHRLYYSKKSGEGMQTARKSSLPYRPEFIGFFGNAASRTHKPF